MTQVEYLSTATVDELATSLHVPDPNTLAPPRYEVKSNPLKNRHASWIDIAGIISDDLCLGLYSDKHSNASRVSRTF